MIKLAAMDMDGTFLRTDKSVSEYTQEVMRRAEKSGMVLVAASGRPEDSLARCIKGVEGFSYAICSNGSVILELARERVLDGANHSDRQCEPLRQRGAFFREESVCDKGSTNHGTVIRQGSLSGHGERVSSIFRENDSQKVNAELQSKSRSIPGSRVVRRLLMEEESVMALLRVIEELDAPSECFVDGRSFVSRDYWEDAMRFGATPRSAAYIRATRSPVDDIRSFIFDHRHELDAVDILTDYVDLRERALERVSGIGGIYITSSVASLVEISHEASGKAPALAWLCEKLGIAPDATIAFGNEENDREMLSWAGIGVAVANSPESLKNSADIIAPDNDSDGVAQVLERYL